MTLEEAAGDGFIDVTALGLQSSVPALELRGVRRCRAGRGGAQRAGRAEGGEEGPTSLWPQARPEHILASQSKDTVASPPLPSARALLHPHHPAQWDSTARAPLRRLLGGGA